MNKKIKFIFESMLNKAYNEQMEIISFWDKEDKEELLDVKKQLEGKNGMVRYKKKV